LSFLPRTDTLFGMPEEFFGHSIANLLVQRPTRMTEKTALNVLNRMAVEGTIGKYAIAGDQSRGKKSTLF
jgi:hypothetical protein